MRFAHRTVLRLVAPFFGLALLWAAPAEATVNNVNATPGTANVRVDQTVTLTVTWTVLDTASNSRTVFSNRGRFRLGGTVIATVNRTLSRLVTALGPQSVVFTEVVRVPRSVAVQAAKSGAQLRFERVFEDDDDPGVDVTSQVTLTPVGGASSLLSISRIELTFEDPPDARYAAVARGARLRPVARLRFGGSGRLDARWVIADPTSTGGRAIFRTRELVRRLLTSAGEVEILGPVLPTGLQGLYEVRFEVDDPQLDEAPRLLYSVRLTPDSGLGPSEAEISLISPPPRSVLSAESRIAWQALAGVVAYKVIFYESIVGESLEVDDRARYGQEPEPPASRPGRIVAGFYLPGENTESAVPSVSMTHLEAGARYYVQVIAWGPDGTIVGRSAPREILHR